MFLVHIGFVTDDLGVMLQTLTGRFVIIDESDFLANTLNEPDRSAVGHPEIPASGHRLLWHPGNLANPTRRRCLAQELAVIATD